MGRAGEGMATGAGAEAEPGERAAPAARAPHPQAGTRPPTRLLAGVLAASSLVQATVSLPIQALPPLAPILTAQFGLSRAEFGLYPSAYYLGSITAMTLWGSFADRGDIRRVYVLGLLIAALACAALVAAPTFPVFLGMLTVGGIGGGLPWP